MFPLHRKILNERGYKKTERRYQKPERGHKNRNDGTKNRNEGTLAETALNYKTALLFPLEIVPAFPVL